MTELKPDSWSRAQALFKAVLQRDAAQRPAFLAEACDGDTQLKAQIEQLLDQTHAVLTAPPKPGAK